MDFILSHKNLVIFTWLFFLFLLEHIVNKSFDSKKFLSEGNRWIKNGVFGFINRILGPITIFPILIWATEVHLWQRPTWTDNAIFIILDIIILDFVNYCFHFISHHVPFLWRFHEVHHLDSNFDSTTGLRIHFGELLIQNLFRVIPVIVFAMPLKSILIFELVLIIEGLFHHANLIFPKKVEDFLSKIIVTPLRHCVHHHSLYTHWNSNFGFIFIWWDKLLGTYCDAERQANWHIGLGYAPDLKCFDLLLSPFKLQRLRYRMKAQGYKVVKHLV